MCNGCDHFWGVTVSTLFLFCLFLVVVYKWVRSHNRAYILGQQVEYLRGRVARAEEKNKGLDE